jgi:hypothetical protein
LSKPGKEFFGLGGARRQTQGIAVQALAITGIELFERFVITALVAAHAGFVAERFDKAAASGLAVERFPGADQPGGRDAVMAMDERERDGVRHVVLILGRCCSG